MDRCIVNLINPFSIISLLKFIDCLVDFAKEITKYFGIICRFIAHYSIDMLFRNRKNKCHREWIKWNSKWALLAFVASSPVLITFNCLFKIHQYIQVNAYCCSKHTELMHLQRRVFCFQVFEVFGILLSTTCTIS